MHHTLRNIISAVLALVLGAILCVTPALAAGKTIPLPDRITDAEGPANYATYDYDSANSKLYIRIRGNDGVDALMPYLVSNDAAKQNQLLLCPTNVNLLGQSPLVLSGKVKKAEMRHDSVDRAYAEVRGIKEWHTFIEREIHTMRFTVENGRLVQAEEEIRTEDYVFRDLSGPAIQDQSTYLSTMKSQFAYDSNGRLTSIHNTIRSRDDDHIEEQTYRFSYDKNGSMTGAVAKQYRNGRSGKIATDGPSSFRNGRLVRSDILDWDLAYNENGMLSEVHKRDRLVTEPTQALRTFTYDDEGRLISSHYEEKKTADEPEPSDLLGKFMAFFSDPDSSTKTFNVTYWEGGISE